MTDIITKASVAAVKEETAGEGTPIKPSAVGDYFALQDDFVMSPGTAVLENAEFKASIGKSKAILGAEAPTATGSHYLKGSGTAATAPAYGLFLKAAFGTETIRSTERNTVSGSTVAVLNVDSGEGVEFIKGSLALIKDSSNGYSVRFIESIATDALTMGFNVANAPAAGVDLGRDVLYSPAQSGHVSLSLWQYLGNGGAIQLLAGARTTEFGFDATAGELLNGTYSFEGKEYFLNPVKITSSNKYLDFDDAGGEENASITEKTYKNPTQLGEAIEVAMNALTTDVITVTYSDTTGKFTIATDGASLSLLWNTGTNTANTIGGELGFTVAADDTGALTYTSDSAITLSAPQTPTYDDSDPLAAKSHEVMIGSATDYACFEASSISGTMTLTKSTAGSICSDSGLGTSIISDREISISVSSLLQQYDSKQYDRYEKGTEIRFQYTFGEKSAGNWVEGKTGAMYIGSATIEEFSIDDSDGLVQLNMTLSAFVNSTGDGEFFLGFV